MGWSLGACVHECVCLFMCVLVYVCVFVYMCVCVCKRERERERAFTAGMYTNQNFTKWMCCTKSNATVTNTCTDTVVAVPFLNIVTTYTCDSCSKVLVMVIYACVYERVCYCA